MDVELYRSFCLQLPFTTEGFPFGGDTLVFKVKNKMFALSGIDTFESINLKCDPEKAIDLREQYAAVLPGYHMNKKLWNTILMDNSVEDTVIKQWIVDSYMLVVQGLSKKERFALDDNYLVKEA